MKIIPALLAALTLSAAPFMTLWAQSALDPVGEWHLYPVFSSPASKIAETSDLVYGISGGSLFSYNTATDERRTLTVDNLLNDFEVADVCYNPRGKYLLVVYDNGNLDLLYDDGRVINMPDIKAASGISGSRAVNNVSFGDGLIYVATDFGIVIFDDTKYEVIRSGNFGEQVSAVCELGDKIFILKDNSIYYAPKDGLINRLDRFTKIFEGLALDYMMPFNSSSLLLHGTYNFFILGLTDNLTAAGKRTYFDTPDGKYTSPVMLADSTFHTVLAGNILCSLGRDAKLTRLATIPEPLRDQVYSFDRGVDNLWALDKHGLALYSVADAENPVVKKDKYMPETMSVKCVANIIPSADGERIYFSNLGSSVKRLSSSQEGERTPQQTSVLADGKFTDVAPYPISAKSFVSRSWQGSKYKWLMSPSRLAEDPDSPDTYFLGTNTDGLYRITDGEESGHFDETNSPLPTSWSGSTRVFEVGFDRGGNLWIMTQRFGGDMSNPLIMVLPASKKNADTSAITPSDWIIVPVSEHEEGTREPRLLFCKKSNMIFAGMNGLVAIDTKGTFSDLSDDNVTYHSSFTDQDGKTFNYTTILSLEEDRDGRVWVGTDAGVFEITNPAGAVSTSMVINHIKIPLNDGTNTAEYLLPSEWIYGISTDNANRKWIATRSSGLFLVSQRGDRIIQNYTADNSPLPDNMVHDVYADPRDNRVWIGTSRGLLSYSSDASPVRDDFSDIYAYPNPVRPDYTGLISIVGLMDNTLVKITDAAGMIIRQMQAEGGMARWDGCNMRGERVRSGVYYVFASSGNGESSSSGAVTKILVVN